MTPRQINKAVEKLNSELYRMTFGDIETFYKYVENEAKCEFERIYKADESLESLNKRNILVMLHLNLKHRFIPFHIFGSKIELF